MPRGRPKGLPKVGGRQKGTGNKLISSKLIGRKTALTIAAMDRKGRSMAAIQIDVARKLERLAKSCEEKGDVEGGARHRVAAAKVAKDVSPYLYSTHQSIKHSGDEDAPPIRIESLSDFQLEQLIKRLSK